MKKDSKVEKKFPTKLVLMFALIGVMMFAFIKSIIIFRVEAEKFGIEVRSYFDLIYVALFAALHMVKILH